MSDNNHKCHYFRITYDWEAGAKDIKNAIGKPIDVVFSGDDYKGKNRWETLYPESKIVYFPRSEVNISSTEIRFFWTLGSKSAVTLRARKSKMFSLY